MVMMDSQKLLFVFSLVVFFEIVFAAPYSQREFHAERAKLDAEMEDVSEEKKVDKLSQKVVIARLETKAEIKKQGALEEQKSNCEKPLRVLGFRSECEDFVKNYYPKGYNPKNNETIYGRPAKKTYMDCLNDMVSSTHPTFTRNPYIKIFRNRLTERNITGPVFLKYMRWLYGQTSSKAAHKMAQFSPTLPEYYEVEEIRAMLKCVGIKRDKAAVVSVQIILQPFDLPDDYEDPSAVDYLRMLTNESDLSESVASESDTDCKSEDDSGVKNN